MVCDSCQSKLSKVAVEQGRGAGGPSVNKTNKALMLKKAGSWIPENQNCKICKSKILKNMKYCNDCAHKKGKCAMCGKLSVDVKSHKMSLK